MGTREPPQDQSRAGRRPAGPERTDRRPILREGAAAATHPAKPPHNLSSLSVRNSSLPSLRGFLYVNRLPQIDHLIDVFWSESNDTHVNHMVKKTSVRWFWGTQSRTVTFFDRSTFPIDARLYAISHAVFPTTPVDGTTKNDIWGGKPIRDSVLVNGDNFPPTQD